MLSQINKICLTFFIVQTGDDIDHLTFAIASASLLQEKKTLEEEFSQNFEDSIDDEHQQQQ